MTELPSIEEIASLLKELASRANGYWEEFAENVEFVKLSLVQPFLRLMGWNPEDPEDVKPMYVSGLAVFDYALMGDEGDTPVSMVSVSKLGFLEAVRGRLVDLAVGCSRSGVSYLVCTDGVEWAVYSVDDLDSPILSWNLLRDSAESILGGVDRFRKLLGLESGRYEEMVCYTRGGNEVKVKSLEDVSGLILKGASRTGSLPYSHIAKMLREGKVVFLSGSGISNKNITYIRKRIESEVGVGVECRQAIYMGEEGYSFAIKGEKKVTCQGNQDGGRSII
jgi:hypothetical protein